MNKILKVNWIYILFILIFFSSCSESSSQVQPVPAISLEEQIKTKFYSEVSPASSANCFAGAYYRKAVSSKDFWLGIGGRVVLPSLTYDLTRENPNKLGTYLDNASIYLGGTSDDQETDIGMTWEVIREADGSVSKERKAFRPFMRRTSHKGGQAAVYQNAPATSNYYWYPGETISMSIQVIEPKKLKFIVEGAGKKYEEIFEADGYQKEFMANYKRVNAIDQVSNEGKPVQTTKAKVTGAKWLEVYLFRSANAQIVKAPMHSKRFTDMQCPGKSYFDILSSGESGENIDIFGSR
jgi:hypothetical protein